MDNMSKADRSLTMSKIRSAETKPERVLRSQLHKLGFRFRKNVKELPGTPDVVLAKFRTVIFVHGCFWHQHKGCPWCTFPKSRTAYWRTKFEKTALRDAQNLERVAAQGWKAIEVWECEIKKMDPSLMPRILRVLNQNN